MSSSLTPCFRAEGSTSTKAGYPRSPRSSTFVDDPGHGGGTVSMGLTESPGSAEWPIRNRSPPSRAAAPLARSGAKSSRKPRRSSPRSRFGTNQPQKPGRAECPLCALRARGSARVLCAGWLEAVFDGEDAAEVVGGPPCDLVEHVRRSVHEHRGDPGCFGRNQRVPTIGGPRGLANTASSRRDHNSMVGLGSPFAMESSAARLASTAASKVCGATWRSSIRLLSMVTAVALCSPAAKRRNRVGRIVSEATTRFNSSFD